MGKTKLMVSVSNLDVLKISGKYPCGVCQAKVCRKYLGSILVVYAKQVCVEMLYRQWVHKKCSGIKGFLNSDLNFRCALCLGTARLVDG